MQKANILDFIPYGADKAVSRSFLALAVHANDRQVREMIRAASTPEKPIVWCSKGYFIPTEKDYKYVQSYYRQESARERSVGDNCRVVLDWLREHKNCEDITPYGKQMSIFDLAKE